MSHIYPISSPIVSTAFKTCRPKALSSTHFLENILLFFISSSSTAENFEDFIIFKAETVNSRRLISDSVEKKKKRIKKEGKNMGLLACIGVISPFPFYYWLWKNPQSWVDLCGKERDPCKVMALVSHFLKMVQFISLFSVSKLSWPPPLYFWPLFIFGQFLNFRFCFSISLWILFIDVFFRVFCNIVRWVFISYSFNFWFFVSLMMSLILELHH